MAAVLTGRVGGSWTFVNTKRICDPSNQSLNPGDVLGMATDGL